MSVSPAACIKIDWNKEVVMELIGIFKEKECLYNTKCTLYHNKHARAEALEDITKKISATVPNVTANEVKIKLNYLRSQYGREVLRVAESLKKSGSGSDDVYVPTAYWYEHLHFLRDFMQCRKGKSNLSFILDDSSLSELDEEPSTSRFKVSCISLPEDLEPTSAKKIKQSNDESDAVLKTAAEFLKKISDDKPEDDYAETFSSFVKCNLAQITDSNLRDEFSSEVMNLISVFKKKNNVN